jgi:hypothetical protein
MAKKAAKIAINNGIMRNISNGVSEKLMAA